MPACGMEHDSMGWPDVIVIGGGGSRFAAAIEAASVEQGVAPDAMRRSKAYRLQLDLYIA